MGPDTATELPVHTDTGIHRGTPRTQDGHTHWDTHTFETQGNRDMKTEAHTEAEIRDTQ